MDADLFKAQTEGSFKVENPESVAQAWAVVHGLGDVLCCRGCGERCVSFSLVEHDPNDVAIAICPMCLRDFRSRHGLHPLKFAQSLRVIRYAAFKGWLTNGYHRWVERVNVEQVDEMAWRDGEFRLRPL